MECYNELYHHGVKGQQWGVRHGPPYPIEDKIIRKGTKINSVRAITEGDYRGITRSKRYAKKAQEAYRKSGRWLYTYNKDNEWDNKVYKGAFSRYIKDYRRGAAAVAEFQFEIKKDLKMPTKQERVNEFKDLLNGKFKNTVTNELEWTCNRLVQLRIGSEKDIQNYKSMVGKMNNLQTDKDYEIAYNVFNHMMESIPSYRSTQEYAKQMSKKYDAMVDDNNQGWYNRAQDPVIIFRANQALKSIGDVKIVSEEEIQRNMNEVREELKKHGENLKL